MFPGILAGVAAAFFQDCGYLFSRIYVTSKHAPSSLLIFTQVIMGAAGLLMLPFIWDNSILHDGFFFLLPLCGASFGSLGGQYFFFRAEKKVEASRLSSLIGLRVVVIAILSAIFLGDHYDFRQITGIVLAAFSALVMNWQHGKLDFNGMGSLGLALLCYALSDMSVGHLVLSLKTDSILHSSLIAMSFVNLLLCAVMLPGFFRIRNKKEITGAVPFAGSWLIKQLFLYICYAMIGPVFGNVIMALRGPIAIILTFILLAFGVKNLEGNVSRRTWIRRIAATAIMFGAIVLYLLSGNVKL